MNSIHIILGASTKVTAEEILSVRKYLEDADLAGFWGLGELTPGGGGTFLYPCDEDGARDKKRKKLLPNSSGEKANVRAMATILAMVATKGAVADPPQRQAPVVIPLEEEKLAASQPEAGDEWEADEALLEKLLGQRAVAQPPEEAANFLGPAWDMFDCGA